MSFLPIPISKEKRQRKYKCLGCRQLIRIDQAACDHCERPVGENDREQMRRNYRHKTLTALPGLILVLVFVVLLIFYAKSLV